MRKPVCQGTCFDVLLDAVTGRGVVIIGALCLLSHSGCSSEQTATPLAPTAEPTLVLVTSTPLPTATPTEVPSTEPTSAPTATPDVAATEASRAADATTAAMTAVAAESERTREAEASDAGQPITLWCPDCAEVGMEVNLFSAPGGMNPMVGSLPHGTQCTLIERQTDYVQVDCPGVSGWLRSTLVK